MTAPWEEAEDQNIIQTLKKTKRKSLIRSILISVVVSAVVLIAVFIGAAQLVNQLSNNTLYSEQQYMRISSPNEFDSGFKDNRGFYQESLNFKPTKSSMMCLFPGRTDGSITTPGGSRSPQVLMEALII